jgi:hypothetical protein
VPNHFTGYRSGEKIRDLLHLASTICFQRWVGRDRSAFTVSAVMVEAAAHVARQPRTITSNRDQIQHDEKCGKDGVVLMSTLYPALTGAAG